jgi:hypothetical protein
VGSTYTPQRREQPGPVHSTSTNSPLPPCGAARSEEDASAHRVCESTNGEPAPVNGPGQWGPPYSATRYNAPRNEGLACGALSSVRGCWSVVRVWRGVGPHGDSFGPQGRHRPSLFFVISHFILNF